MSARRAGFIALLIALAAARGSSAQDRPVVFIHGLMSSDAAWADTARRLEGQLSLTAYRPKAPWADVYPAQAAQVQNVVGHLPGSAVAVGHSNGGVVAREWSKNHPLSALVTLGTPNAGAPLAANMLNFVHYNYAAGDAITEVYAATARCVRRGCGWGSVLSFRGIGEILGWVRSWMDASLWTVVSTVGVGTGAPVLAQMAPGSSYLSGLNSTANLARERASVSGRVGVAVTAHNFYNAGVFRLAWPEAGDAIDFWKDLSVNVLDYLSMLIQGTADYEDWLAFDIANAMSMASAWLGSIDQRWCETVSSWPGSGLCGYNDEVVPVWSQVLPDAPFLWNQDGPIHTREIQESDYYLYQALTAFAHIPPRGASGGGTGGGGGGGSSSASFQLTENSAVRGCSNYVERPPIYRPSAAECASACATEGADACEWYHDGSCFVEFGAGCGLQGGFGGWWAGVLRGGSTSGGGGEGGGTASASGMQAGSAVRGCVDYVEHPPVHQPTADACLSYCMATGGDACEWYGDGSCFVEQGSQCRTEPGYDGWSAAVIR